MDGYTVSEAASVLGVSTERVWELLARGVLAGTPEGLSGMVVYLQPRPGPMTAPPPPAQEPGDSGPGRPRGPNGHDGELSPFRELLTEFRNLTERYGQALLALGEARGEVASLRGRVELLEARVDLRLPPPQAAPPRRAAWEFAPEEPEEAVDAEQSTAGAGAADVESEAPVPSEPELGTAAAAPTPAPPVPAKRPRRGEKATKRRSPARPETRRRPALAEALARAEDPTLAVLPGGREAADALAAFQASETQAPAPSAPEALQPEAPEPEVSTPAPLATEALQPDALAPEALAPEKEMGAPWDLAPASELPFAEEPTVAAAPESEVAPALSEAEVAPAPPETEMVPADAWAEVGPATPTAEVQTVEEGGVAAADDIPAETEPLITAVVDEVGGPDASVPVEIEAVSEEPAAVWEEAEPAGSPYTAQLEEPDWFSDADLAATGDQGYPVAGPMTAPEPPAPAWELPQPPFAPPEIPGLMPDEAAEFEAPAFEAVPPDAEAQASYPEEPELAGDETSGLPADAISTMDESSVDDAAGPGEEFWAYEQPAAPEAEWSRAAESVFESGPVAPAETLEGGVDIPDAVEAPDQPSMPDASLEAATEDLSQHEAVIDGESWAYVEEALEPEAVVELTAPETRADIDASPAAEVSADQRAADVSVARQWSAAEAGEAAEAAGAEEEVMWLGSTDEPAMYAEEMEVSTSAAAAGFTPVAEPSSEEQPPSDAPTTASLPDDIYVEGWSAAAPEAPHEPTAASPIPTQPSTGSPELDEGLAALDALARMAAARRAVKSQPSAPTREPPLTGDEIVQRLRSQMAAERGNDRARPAPASTPIPPASAPTPPASSDTQPASPAPEAAPGRMRDQRSPASRAYRRLRRIFPG